MVNYLSIEGLPWLFSCWICLFFFRPLATFIHEIGHLIPLYFLSNGDLYLRIGEGTLVKRRLGRRLTLEFSWNKIAVGSVYHDGLPLSLISRLLVLLGGPLCTSIMVMILAFMLKNVGSTLLEVSLIGFLCSNILTLLTSILPMRLRPTKEFPEGPPSDFLEILLLFQSRKNKQKF
jgi:hypothetical protein